MIFHHRYHIASIMLTLGTVTLMGGALKAGEPNKEELIKSALSGAPPMIAATAAVKDSKGNVLRPGSGAYTCFPREQAGTAPICVEKAWEAWIDARKNNKPFTAPGVGIAYMLAGDAPDGGASNVDPQAKAPTEHNHWVVEGPHVMILVPDAAALDSLPAEPGTGDPYVMWKGTPYAHIMAPVAARPEQRAASR